MGSKGKQTQRTKGNVRPSSSGRTAELLENVGGFVGFSGISEPTFVPLLNTSTNEEADLIIQPDFRLTMRKMSKKDVVTKVKALQEFASLCASHSLEDVQSALPFWPRLYNKLAIESDRRVRETTQKAHQALVSLLGRKLAPHLKALIGVWFTSQDDNYAPAATVALHSFRTTFPSKKQVEAVSLYQSDILSYIEDSIMHLTLQNVGDTKISPMEELETKFERVMYGALAGYVRLLQLLPKEELAKCEAIHKRIISSPKFWNLVGRSPNAPCKSSSLKQAYFSLLSALLARFPVVLEESSQKAKICPLVFGFMDETDSVVLPVVWDAVLQTLANMPDCWEHVNANKVVLPKLFSVLKAGGHGNAVQFYHSFLPFLSHLPDQVRGDNLTFYTTVFENFRTGLSLPAMKKSSSEAAAVMTSFVECLRYVIKTKPELRDMCLKEQVFPVLKLVFADAEYRFPSSLFQSLSQAFQSWTKDDVTTRETFLNELRGFVMRIVDELIEELSSAKLDSTKISHQTELLASLFHNLAATKDRTSSKATFGSPKVRFADGPPSSQPISATAKPYDAGLAKLALEIVQKLLPSIDNHSAPNGVSLVADLLTNVGFTTSLQLIYPAVGFGETVELFLRNYCLSWLAKPKLHCAAMFNLTLALICTLNRDPKIRILNEFLQSLEPDVTCQFLSIAYPALVQDSGFQVWIRDSLTKAFLMRIPNTLACQDNRNAGLYWKLVRVLLKEGVGIPSDIACKLLAEFEKTLCDLKETEKAPKGVEKFVTGLNGVLNGDAGRVWMNSREGRRIANIFFTLAMNQPLSLSEDVKRELLETWRQCVNGSLAVSGESEMLSLVKQSFEACKTDETGALTDIILNLFELLASEAGDEEENTTEEGNDLLQRVFKELLPSAAEWQEWRNRKEVLGFLLTLEEKITTPVTTDCVKWSKENEKHLLKRLRFADLAQTLFVRFPVLAQREENVTLWTEILYTYAFYDVISKTACNLNKDAESAGSFALEHSLLVSTSSQVSKAVFDKANAEGFGWAWSLHLLLAKDAVDAKVLEISTSDSMTMGQLHTLQVIMNDRSDVRLNIMGEEAPRLLAFSKPEMPFDAPEWVQIQAHLALFNSSMNLTTLSEPDLLTNLWNHYVSIIADTLMHWHQVKGDGMLFSGINSLKDCGAVGIVTEITRFMRILMKFYSQHLLPPHWDWILCSLASWSLSIEESWQLAFKCYGEKKEFEYFPWLLLYSTSACSLAKTIIDLVASPVSSHGKELPESLSTEWNDVFSESVYNTVASIFVPLSGLWEHLEKIPGAPSMVYSLSAVFAVISKDSLLKLFESRAKGKSCEVISKALCPLLLSQQTAMQAAAFEALQKIIQDLAVEGPCDSDEKDDNVGDAPPSDLLEVLTQVDAVVESITEHADYGSNGRMIMDKTIVPAVVSYIYVWRTVLSLCQGSSAEKRSRYVTYLWEKNYLRRLFETLFKLMPSNPLVVEEKSTTVAVYFTKELSLLRKELATVEDVRHLSCQLYLRLLQRLPAAARRWWGELEKRFSMEVDAYTSKYVSPVLCNAELKNVETDERRFDNMKVKVRLSTREIMATYLLDESSLEVSVQLPVNYPLGPVNVEGGKRVGVKNSQWRNWMLQLTTFLLNQNGSICDGLELWKRNVDKRFEGVEECYICYYVLHGSNYQLPRLSCRTCKKKFHSACLYKWFNTSNNSTCPLCRNLF